MNFNKFLKKNNILYLILIVLLIFGSLYFLTNNFKLIEGQKGSQSQLQDEATNDNKTKEAKNAINQVENLLNV